MQLPKAAMEGVLRGSLHFIVVSTKLQRKGGENMTSNIPAGRVSIRVSTAYTRSNVTKGETFVSLIVADAMVAGYDRLPQADIVSYALSSEMWKQLLTELKKRGAKTGKGVDKKGVSYTHFKPMVIELFIQLDRPMAVKEVGRKTTALSIAGNVVGINVREKRAGNSIALED
jgi:hypothetical protein